MNNTQKTIASIATAAVLIGGGVAVYETSNDESKQTTLTSQEIINSIDWSKYDLNIPTIDVPNIQVTNLGLPEVKLPQVDEIKIVPVVVNLDNTEVSLPKIEENKIEIPMIAQNSPVDDEIINLTKTIIEQSNIDELNKSIGGINNTLKLFNIVSPDQGFDEWVLFAKDNTIFFVDKRMVSHDVKMTLPNEIIESWKKIYNSYENVQDIKYVPIKNKFRMITEVRTPLDNYQLNILTENLKFYKSEGYDSVLYGFTEKDNPYDVLNTIKYIIKYCGMKVWLTYTGEETLKKTVFMNPEIYTQILTQSAPYISGYLNSWRRTSVHLWKQDKAFMNYTNHILRNVNPNLPIIGELYYGNNYKYQGEGNVGFEMNNFTNSSGIMIVNFGFKRIAVKYLLNTVLKLYIGNIPKIACVVGERPYYLTDNKNHLDYKKNLELKHQIENNFFNNGCIGVITLSNDGRYWETNNLSKTLYNTLSSK